MIISKDPLTGDSDLPIHPGFFRSILRNPEENYIYALLITNPNQETSFKGLMFGDCQLDLGHFPNMLTDDAVDVLYTITV